MACMCVCVLTAFLRLMLGLSFDLFHERYVCRAFCNVRTSPRSEVLRVSGLHCSHEFLSEFPERCLAGDFRKQVCDIV